MRREREMQRKTQKRGADAKADAKAREATFAPLIHALLFRHKEFSAVRRRA